MAYVDIDGVAWHYVEKGQGPLLLFGHSTFVDHRLFNALIDALSSHYRCVALDWPGHGRSGWNAAGWSMTDLVEGVDKFITAIGETQAILAGVSVGAAVFLRYALVYPLRVRALVYMSARPDPHTPEAAAWIYDTAVQLQTGSDAQRREIFSGSTFEALMHSPGWRAANPAMAEHELQMQLDVPLDALPLIAQVLTTSQPTTPHLHRISCPVLVLFGGADPGVEWAERVGQAVVNGQVCIVPAAGHHLPLDAPDQTLASVSSFLDELDGNRSHR